MAIDKTCFSWIQLIKKSDLPPNAKYVCFYLSTFMNLEHDIAWPSQARIAHETGLARSTVQKWLYELDKIGWLISKSKAHPVKTASGVQMQNEYMINIPDEVARSAVDHLQGGPMNGKRWPDERQKVARPSGTNNNINNNRSNNKLKGIKIPTIKDDKEW